jgi:hypothetical protein
VPISEIRDRTIDCHTSDIGFRFLHPVGTLARAFAGELCPPYTAQ